MFRILWTAALAIRVRPHTLHRFHQARGAVHDDEQRGPEPAAHEVLQETEPRVVRFPRPEIEMQEHRAAVVEQGVGREHALFLVRALARRVILAIQKDVDHWQLTKVAPPPRLEVLIQLLRHPAHVRVCSRSGTCG
jgi:hypothetical protein